MSTAERLDAPVARATDLDVGSRLYTARTRSSAAKTASVTAADRDTQRLLAQMQNVDVRDEVDRIYDAILTQVDGGSDGAATADYFPTSADYARLAGGGNGGRPTGPVSVISGVSTSRFRPHVNPLALSKLRSNTFGSSERDVNRKLAKSAEPGPGSYHQAQQSSFSSGTGTPRWRAPSSGAATRARARQGTDPKAPMGYAPGPGDYRIGSTFDAVMRKPSSRAGTMSGGGKERLPAVRSASPGPGTYDLDGRRVSPSRARQGAAFASSAPRMPAQRSSSPGPQDYRADTASSKTLPQPPRVAMSKAPTMRANDRDDRNSSPGPGQYNVVAATELPARDAMTKGVIPTSGRERGGAFDATFPEDALAPGPGHYEPRRVEADPRSAAIRGPVTRPTDSRLANPGPGAYEHVPASVNREQDAVYTVPKASRFTADERRDADSAQGPSPQSYYADRDVTLLSEHARGPVAVVPTAKRFDEPETDAPGPGTYEAAAQRGEGGGVPATTAPRQTGMVHRDAANMPGPAAYTVEVSGLDHRAAVIGSAVRDPADKEEKPGPGAYTTAPVWNDGHGPSFGTGRRVDDTPPPQSGDVGPGAYEGAQSEFGVSGRGPSMGLPRAVDADEKAAAELPGPGAYHTHEAAESGPAATFSTATRFVAEADEKPGPGAYETSNNGAVEERARGVVIGTSLRAVSEGPRNDDSAPGPGTYEVPSGSGDANAPAFGTAERMPAEKVRDGPGPSDYAVSHRGVEGDARAPTLGTAAQYDTRAQAAASEVPGPGAYSPDSGATEPAVAGIRFGTEVRSLLDDGTVRDGPGPGAYASDRTAVDPRAPSAILGSAPLQRDTVDADKADLPGPGAYEVQPSQAAGPSMAFGTADARPHAAGKDVPGPGTYSPDALATMEASRAAFIGTADRQGLSDKGGDDVPGPGAYAPHDQSAIGGGDSTGPAFGTATRTETRSDQELPGPGAYTPAQQDHVPTVVMHTAPRMPAQPEGAAAAPGPGAYTPAASGPLNQAPTFGSALRADGTARSAADVPGPGAYEAHATASAAAAPTSAVIGTAPRVQAVDPENMAPGPGAYSPLSKEMNPHLTTIPLADRFAAREAAADQPGPGAYSPSTAPTDPQPRASTIPLANRGGPSEAAAAADVPGPGAYDPHRGIGEDGAPAVGISFHRPPTAANGGTDAADLPGPGSYEVRDVRDPRAPVLGTASRAPTDAKGTAAAVPGPGAYNPDDYVANPAPAVTIGPLPSMDSQRLARELALLRDAPGPGSYETPAPGHAHDSAPSYTFGTTERFDAKDGDDKDGPGPGAYIGADGSSGTYGKDVPAVTIPKAERFAADGGGGDGTGAGADVPGPGMYDTPALPAGPHALVLGKGAGADGSKRADGAAGGAGALGPGQYDAKVDAVLPKAPAYSFPAGAHGDLDADARAARDAPGPAQYDVVRAEGAVQPHAPSALMLGRYGAEDGDDAAGAARRDAPGPGQYDPRVDAHGDTGRGEMRSILLAPRDPRDGGNANADSGLGPNAYDPHRADRLVYPAVPAATIYGRDGTGDASGAGDGAAVAPGPGQYDIGSALDPHAYTIPRAERHGPGAEGDVPGPGYYATSALGAAGGDGSNGPGPAWTFGRAEAGPGDVPVRGLASGLGAGQYDAGRAHDRVLPSSLYTTIPKAQRTDDQAGHGTGAYVGPGAYNLGPAPYAGPEYSMSNTRNAQPDPREANGAPGTGGAIGPGYYNVGGTLGGPSFTIGGRRPDGSAGGANPGPGAYNLVDYDPYRRATVGVDLSRGRGDGVQANPGLGPGHYTLPSTLGDARAARMHWRYVEPYYEPTPGPPDYNPGRPQPAFHRPHSEAF